MKKKFHTAKSRLSGGPLGAKVTELPSSAPSNGAKANEAGLIRRRLVGRKLISGRTAGLEAVVKRKSSSFQ
ncbi:MAG: hypothetical protein KDI02_25775, partial [Anaerolineae bacterium]|nr:hypothetical protein [Anaerolineae bacterium]